jgi:hypothetical protein
MKNRDPDSRKQLIYSCEDELYKYKKKLFPKSQNNMGEGFSTFFDENTRVAILKEVKKEMHRRKKLQILKKNAINVKD